MQDGEALCPRCDRPILVVETERGEMVTLDLAAAVYRIQAFGGRLRAEKMPQGDPISGDYHTVFLVEHAEVCRR